MSEAANRPNFFILGAAKSGTTSLYDCLKQHPDIFMSPVKEPTFFCEQFQIVDKAAAYFKLFDEASEEKVIGEASHAYMTDPESPKMLKALFPDAKFMVILRNPADRAYSLYQHMVRRGDEWASTFEQALELEERRKDSRRFKDHCPQYFYNFLYFNSGLYGEQLQRYFSFFDVEQFHVMTLSEFMSNTQGTLRKAFDFLEVDPEFSPNLDLKNEGGFTVKRPPVQYAFEQFIQHPRFLRHLGKKALRSLNRMEVRPMAEETRQRLLARYGSDLELLGQLTGITLR